MFWWTSNFTLNDQNSLTKNSQFIKMGMPFWILGVYLFIPKSPMLYWCLFEIFRVMEHFCHNLNLKLVTKTRACEGAGQVWSPGVTFHAFGNVGKCEGMNPHTPKWTPTLGIGVMLDSQLFKKQFQGSKPIGLKVPYFIGNILERRFLNELSWPIWTLQT